jgi:hypothetical protein
LNANRYLSFEAEVAYDFDQAFTEDFTNSGTGTVAVNRSDVRIFHGLFGPVLSTGRGPIRAFVTVKGGGIDFNLDNAPATFGTFASSVSNIRASNVDALLYPGGGVEVHIGPLGLRSMRATKSTLRAARTTTCGSRLARSCAFSRVFSRSTLEYVRERLVAQALPFLYDL